MQLLGLFYYLHLYVFLKRFENILYYQQRYLPTDNVKKMKILDNRITLGIVYDICSNINYKFFEDFIIHCCNNNIQEASNI